MAGFEYVALEKLGENVADAVAIAATLFPAGKAVNVAERILPEVRATVIGYSESAAAVVTIDSETEALIKTASMEDASLFAPALWTRKPVVAHTLYSHMNVPQWSQISNGMSDATHFLTADATQTNEAAEVAKIAAARLPIVQAAADAITDSHGLARAEFQLSNSTYGNGAFLLGSDTVQLTSQYLAEESIAKVAATASHELTHYEQMHLIVRSMADELGAGGSTTANVTNSVRQQFKQEFGLTLQKRAFEKIMANRDGMALTSREAERAAILRTSIPAGQKLRGLESQVEYEEEELQRILDGIKGSSKVSAPLEDLRYWSDKPGSSMFRMLENNPNLKDLISSLKFDRYGELRPMSKQSMLLLKARLTPIANTGIERTTTSRDLLFDAYLDSYDEREARAVGERIFKQIMQIQKHG